jgi:hypothetical protein
MSVKAYYNAEIWNFLNDDDDRILGIMTAEHHHSLGPVRNSTLGESPNELVFCGCNQG